jgi:hypothetical protein
MRYACKSFLVLYYVYKCSVYSWTTPCTMLLEEHYMFSTCIIFLYQCTFVNCSLILPDKKLTPIFKFRKSQSQSPTLKLQKRNILVILDCSICHVWKTRWISEKLGNKAGFFFTRRNGLIIELLNSEVGLTGNMMAEFMHLKGSITRSF